MIIRQFFYNNKLVAEISLKALKDNDDAISGFDWTSYKDITLAWNE